MLDLILFLLVVVVVVVVDKEQRHQVVDVVHFTRHQSAKCVNVVRSASVRAFEFIMHDGSEQFNVPQVHAMTALSDQQTAAVSRAQLKISYPDSK